MLGNPMSTTISPLAGTPAPAASLVDVSKLLAAYIALQPDAAVPAQRVAFGTSGHRGCSFERSFNEWHVLTITQAICEYREKQAINGPLYIGIDTHALSQPAFESALEVLAANGVQTMIARGGQFTPTPAVSHAILAYNRARTAGLADGIVVTPSHNPPDNGGIKYNTPDGGPADTGVTGWIEARANALLEGALKGVRRTPFTQARAAASTHEHEFLDTYVSDLGRMIDFEAIRSAGIHMGVDPLGGAGVHYWAPIAERYKLDLTVVSSEVDATFRFMTLNWDGKIRMDRPPRTRCSDSLV
jgi:phosphoglucomutase